MARRRQRSSVRIFAVIFAILALSDLPGRESPGAATWEELERSKSGFLEIAEIIDASRILGRGLGTHLDLAVDEKGALLIADADNQRVLRYEPGNGQMESLALPPGRFVVPRAIAVGLKGKLFLANPGLHEILVHDNSWFPLGDLTGFDSHFDHPVDLEIDSSGRVFILDSGKRKVFIVGPEGKVLRSLSVPYTVSKGKVRYGLTALALGSDGSIYLIDGDSQQVLQGDKSGRFHAFVRKPEEEPRSLVAIAMADNGHVIVTDYLSSAILEFTPQGKFAQEHVLYKHLLQQPSNMAAYGDRLFVVNRGKNQILTFTLRSALSGVEHAVLGEEYLAVGYPQKAVQELVLATKLGYDPPEVHLFLGQAYYAQEAYNRAVSQFETILREDPTNIAALFFLANSHYKLKAYQEAVRRYREVLALDPRHLAATYNLGELYLATGDLAKAETYFHKALTLFPQYSKALMGLGRLYLAKEEYRKAEDVFERILDKEPEGRSAKYYLGLTYFRQKEFQKAIPLLQRASSRGPYFIDALYHLGLAYAATGRKDEARQEFHRVLELKPDHSDARQQLSALRRG